jgi:hypothetical protein
MKRILFVVVLAALLLSTTGAVSAAPPPRRTFSNGGDYCEAQEGIWTWRGNTFQDRPITMNCWTEVPGFPELTGMAYMTFKWLEVGTLPGRENWHAIMIGTERLEVPGGAWVGNWNFNPNESSAQIALHGEGKYLGWHAQMTVTPVYDPLDPRTDILSGWIQGPDS